MSEAPSLSLRLLVLWGVFIVYGTIIPFELAPGLDQIEAQWDRAEKIPWIDPSTPTPPLGDVAANVLLFVPWGLLLALHLSRRGHGLATILFAAAMTSWALSSFVELFQLLSPVRRTSATDVFNNVAGGVVGASLGWLLAQPLRDWVEPRLRRAVREQPLTTLAGAVTAAVLFWALAPFDFSLDVDDLKRSVKGTRLLPFGPTLRGSLPLPPLSHYLPATLAWILIGATATLAAQERGLRGAPLWRHVGVYVASLALVSELLQVLTPSRFTDMTTVLFCIAGGLLGLLAALALAPSRVVRMLDLGLVLTVGALLAAGLEPWNFSLPSRDELRLSSLVPFLAYYWRTDVYALADAVLQLLAYLPLGALLALRFPPPRPLLAATAGGLTSLVVEVGQLLLPASYSDATDVLLAAAGAATGAWLLDRSGIRLDSSCDETTIGVPHRDRR